MYSILDFDKYYEFNKSFSCDASLLQFFNDDVLSKLNSNSAILEVGCGNYSIFEDIAKNDFKITAIDFSSVAIKQAPKSHVNYLQVSLIDDLFFDAPKYDLIFDSHCLNCVEKLNFMKAFRNIFKSLNSSGIFASEIMIQPVGYKVVTENNTILDCREIELMLIESGFKIVYFVISKSKVFFVDNKSVDLLRFIAIK
jgi:2-polyprenyl-3-methyl-5-hydroxy-6-metoxy-1,4-benzoquinol methylase